MSDFHYVRTPGTAGGVDAAEGPAIGVELDAVLDVGLPPFGIAMRLIAAVAEILAIAEEDGVVHGDIEPVSVLLDDTGAVSLEGFDRRKTSAPEGTPGGSRHRSLRARRARLLPAVAAGSPTVASRRGCVREQRHRCRPGRESRRDGRGSDPGSAVVPGAPAVASSERPSCHGRHLARLRELRRPFRWTRFRRLVRCCNRGRRRATGRGRREPTDAHRRTGLHRTPEAGRRGLRLHDRPTVPPPDGGPAPR